MKKTKWVISIITILTISVISWNCCSINKSFCKEKLPSKKDLYCDTCYQKYPADEQLIVWREPGATDDEFTMQWIRDNLLSKGDVKITLFCEDCDSNLMLLKGPGVSTFVSGNFSGGGKNCNGCPPAGDSLFWCVNQLLNYPNPPTIKDQYYNDIITDSPLTVPKIDTLKRIRASVVPIFPPFMAGGFTDTSVTVAVFDTGIDPWDIDHYLYSSVNASCLSAMAKNGYNFIAKNDMVDDDYLDPLGHGAMVSRLIVDQVTHYKQNGVKILPVKTHASDGRGDLFGILCGFAYARERGAKIINASFGYYTPKPAGTTVATDDPNTLLLRSYIKYYLGGNDPILLVAAAGNKTKQADGNLDNLNFYPASLAGNPEFSNVIAVTTVNVESNEVSPTENYSKNVVDIGVNASKVHAMTDDAGGLYNDYFFLDPKYEGLYRRGSSFATPVVTGIICAHYSLLKNQIGTGAFNKDAIFNILLQSSRNIGKATDFDGKLRYGVMMDNSQR